MIPTTILMAEKVSDILLNAPLDSDSILHQGHNIKYFFSSTGYMDPLTTKHHQIINTEKIMRREYNDVYNVLYPNCTGILSTEIFYTTMYT